ncbi:transposase, partial [Jeotgalibaca caeni]|uniref:transposase n=1 Tax=Jeotgalibaca caeni TaxID=3028623 RepID=UPI00237E2B56
QEQAIQELEREIDRILAAHEQHTLLLEGIPGIDRTVRSVVIAEIGTDMSAFPSAEHLASWAGLCPGNNESAGKQKSTRISKGNPYLKKVLCQAAYAAIRKKDSHFRRRYNRIRSNRGANKALIAIAHELLRIIYLLFSRQEQYKERNLNDWHKKSVLEASQSARLDF